LDFFYSANRPTAHPKGKHPPMDAPLIDKEPSEQEIAENVIEKAVLNEGECMKLNSFLSKSVL